MQAAEEEKQRTSLLSISKNTVDIKNIVKKESAVENNEAGSLSVSIETIVKSSKIQEIN